MRRRGVRSNLKVFLLKKKKKEDLGMLACCPRSCHEVSLQASKRDFKGERERPETRVAVAVAVVVAVAVEVSRRKDCFPDLCCCGDQK